MAGPADLRVIQHCMRQLRNADPKVYDLFIANLEKYVNELTVAVTSCPHAEIMECRGRAQQAQKFILMFTELPTS